MGAFGAMLRSLRGLIPMELIAGAGWERLVELADRLPGSVIDERFGFEFSLADAEPAADFCVIARPNSRLAGHYVRQGKAAGADSSAAVLGAFLDEQGQAESYLARIGAGIILEYDLVDVGPGQEQTPGIFIVPGGSGKKPIIGSGGPGELGAALAQAAGWKGSAVEPQQVERIYEALPRKCFIAQAGVMPGRAQRAVRLIVQGVKPEEVPPLLEWLQWPGEPAQAAAVLMSVAGRIRTVAVSLDVSARGVAPRLGLELYRPVEWYRTDRAGWAAFVDWLAELGWCVPTKAAGLRGWPRMEHVFSADGPYRVHQALNHVKVVIDGDVTAKAYAGMALVPASRAEA